MKKINIKINVKKATILLCVATLLLFFALSMFNIGKDVVKKMGFNNSSEESEIGINCDWQLKYPFTAEDLSFGLKSKSMHGIFDFQNSSFIKITEKIKTAVNNCTSQKLPGYVNIVSVKRKIDDVLGWNISPMAEYNSVVKWDDGYLVSYVSEIDATPHIESVTSFDSFCRSNNIKFIYVQNPDKISKYLDAEINGVLDYVNKRSDALIEGMMNNGVDNYDLREEIVRDNLAHRELFFKTDHHWTLDAGLWATRKIAKELNSRYGYDFNYNLLSIENFDRKIYKDWFLGSSGKKMTLSVSEPEDISFLYPTFDTKLTYCIPSKGFEKMGDFNVSYDYDKIGEKDYYNENPYGAYAHGDCPLIHIINHLADNDVKILLVKDSNANAVTPFLALIIKETDVIDLRHFDGSLKSFILQHKPDVVILMHYGSAIRDIDYTKHDCFFDLR